MTNKHYNKEIFVKDYFDIHTFYNNIYGKNTIILMQVGSFHEAYCTDTKGLNLIELAQQLDVVCTKKNGNKELSDSNPRMMGFPIHCTLSFIEKLININYTVVLIDQTTEPPNPKREVTSIYSPATFIEKTNNKTCNIVSIVIDKVKTKSKDQLCVGISSYDLTTGNGYVYETFSTTCDELLALDDTMRFLDTVPSKEILLVNKIKEPIANMTPETILQYLHLDSGNNINIFNIKLDNQEKIKYQEQILNKIYQSNNNIFENLNLTTSNYSRLALVILLEYCQHHQPNLLNNIKNPMVFLNDKYLYLGNNALEQLDVFTTNDKGLYKVINYTKTSLGQRYLFDALSKPLINIDEINKRYNSIELLIANDSYKSIENFIDDIYDIEKLNRRINIGNLHPSELNQLYISFYQISKLVEFLKTNKLEILHNNMYKQLLNEVKVFINHINDRFNLAELTNINFTNYYEDTKTFFNNGVYTEIDMLVSKIETGSNFINLLQKELENLLSEEKSLFGKSDNSLITLKLNDRDGHYMLITNRRCKILKEKLKNKSELTIGSYKLKISDLEFSELPKSSNTKINCEKIKEISNEIICNKQKLATLNKMMFKEELKTLSLNFNNLFIYWSSEIGYLDFINSGANCAIKNKYSKPLIKINDSSFFTAVEMRHPIIEIVNKNYNYVPHNIGLGGTNPLDGILLYGINSSGKSTLMKAIGLNIILAQIGYYVPSSSFTYFPYNMLFTRIIGNDNMFKGLSSFMVEMMELTAILKRNNKHTMVIGDEICRGTEEKSANIIVAYMLETLAKTNSCFITATHLHKIASMESIQKLERVKPKHLKITHNKTNDSLIYDRHLSDGQGETFYGLMVAKFLMKDINFNTRTNEILNEYDDMVVPKKSHYNDEYMIECEVCKTKKNLESHHIIPQKDFDDNETHKELLHIKKNNYSNIVTLCAGCHDNVDNMTLIINGWIETSNGRQLDYYNQDKPKIIRHSPELVEYIKSLKYLNDSKMARIKIKEKYTKKISTQTIEKYWV